MNDSTNGAIIQTFRPEQLRSLILDAPLDDGPADQFLKEMDSPFSVQAYVSDLRNVAVLLSGIPNYRLINWAKLERYHVVALRAKMLETLSYRTVNHRLSCIKGVMRAAWQAGLLDAETLARINSVKCVEGEKLPAGKDRSAEEIGAMMDACPGTIIGLRDAAVISLLYATGIRRSELINLDVSDYDPESGALNVRHAKGNRQRLAYVEIPEAKEALEAWLEKRRASVLADERLEKATGNRKGLYDDGPLFLGTNGHESVNARRLTPQSIYNLMHVRGTLAGIPDVTVHDLRRSFCTALLDAGVDVLIVMRLMGHARPETTAIYDRRPERAKQQAAALLHIPRGGDHKTKKTK